MKLFEIAKGDISQLNDGDLRDLIGRLCEAELSANHLPINAVTFGGKQEAPDGGVDVRVNLNINTDKLEFICRPHAIIQVKKHDLQPAACLKEMKNSDGSLKQVIIDTAQSHGAYIVASGAADCSDLTLQNRLKKMREAVAELPEKDQLLLDYYDGNRIASWLRKYPSLTLWVRNKIGKPLSGWQGFAPWATGNINQDQPFLSQSEKYIRVRMTTGETTLSALDGIHHIRQLLNGSQLAIRIIGLSGVGKTRFVQALFEKDIGENPLPDTHVLYADAGKDLDPTPDQAIAQLKDNDGSTIFMVVDNCSSQLHRDLVKTLGSFNCIKLITIEHDIQDDEPERTDVVHIDAIDDKVITALIQNRFAELGLVNAGTIARLAGGNARVALILAEHVEKHENLSQLSDSVLFERIFHQNKQADKDLLKHAEILSLVYSFNINRSTLNDELGQLALIIDENRREVLRSKSELLRRHLMQKRGDWHAILPHAIANYLAKCALENIEYNEISEIILKPENSRLLKSCGHRIGYLHDSEQAINLAKSWLDNNAPLSDFATLNADQMACLYYITPLFPALILNKIEEAIADTFIDNENAKTFIDLLGHIAYDECHFERTIKVLLSYTLSTNESIKIHAIDTIASFYSLYFSGTHASLEKRLDILNSLLLSSHPLKCELIEQIYKEALISENWPSSRIFDFGAQKRDFGWEPQTNGEITSWYDKFINLLKQMLASNDIDLKYLARKIIEDNILNLTLDILSYDEFEQLVLPYSSYWPNLLIAISKLFHNKDSDVAKKILTLASHFKPKTLEEKIKIYVLEPTYNYANFYINKEDMQAHLQLIIEIGKKCAGNTAIFQKFNDQLFTSKSDALTYFGQGIARGGNDIYKEFEFILSQITNCKIENFNPALLTGFLTEVHLKDANLSKQLLDRLSCHKFLQNFYLDFLYAIEITENGLKIALKLAAKNCLKLEGFNNLKLLRINAIFVDNILAELCAFRYASKSENDTLIEILNMRFSLMAKDGYTPSAQLIINSNELLKHIFNLSYDIAVSRSVNSLKTVILNCVCANATIAETTSLFASFYEQLKSNYYYPTSYAPILAIFIQNSPQAVFDFLINQPQKEQLQTAQLLQRSFDNQKNRIYLDKNLVKIIVEWCNAQPNRFSMVAMFLSCYQARKNTIDGYSFTPTLNISDDFLTFLNSAPNKSEIIERIFNNAIPISYTGSIVPLLENHQKALAEFLHHPIEEVRIEATKQLQNWDNRIIAAQKREQEIFKDKLQSFE